MKVSDLLNSLKKVKDELVSGAGNAVNNAAQYFNPTSNGGNNFWSSPVANTMANTQRTVQSIPQQVTNVAKSEFPKIAPFIPFTPQYNARPSNPISNKVFGYASQKLQSIPQVNLPQPKNPNQFQPIGPFVSTAGINRNIANFALDLPGSMFRSYGKSIGNLGTDQGRQQLASGYQQLKSQPFSLNTLNNPIVQTGLDMTDFLPGGLFIGSLGKKAIRTVSKEGIEKVIREGGEQVAKQTSEKALKEEAIQLAKDEARNILNKSNPGGLLSETLAQTEFRRKAGLNASEYTPSALQALQDEKLAKLNDITPLSKGMNDIYRNFKAVYKQDYPAVKKAILDPFDNAKGTLVKNLDNWATKLNTDIVEGLGIKKGSKESAAVQLFGEGHLRPIELVKRFGEQKANNIIKADQWFRTQYTTLLNEVNHVRGTIYPNNPEMLIPFRQDYYRHFQELTKGFEGLKNIFDRPSNISSSLTGISEFTKPKSRWLSFAQKRTGEDTTFDAVGGFIQYVGKAEYAKSIDPFIEKFRMISKDLETATLDGPNKGRVNNFIEFLHDFANDLSGKTNPLDRPIQKYVGRKTMGVINWLNSRVKANVILGNLSSSIAQLGNIPQGLASAGPVNSVKGMAQSLKDIFVENKAMAESSFIRERYFNAFDKFDTGIINDSKKFASWITSVLDEVGTKVTWNAHFEQAAQKGITNLVDRVKYADDLTRNLVAGRGIGEVPLIQKSKVFQLIAPFQLEVSNLWHVMKDMVDEKQFGKLIALFIYFNAFNRAAKAIRGSDVVFDPIQALTDGYQSFQEESNKGIGALKMAGRLGGEILSNVPGGQTVAEAYPEYGFTVGDTKFPTRSSLFGEGDPTRFGSGLLATKGLQDPLFKILPPFGGAQLKRTIEGLGATNKGYSQSQSGLVQYPITQTPLNYLKSATFGKNSTPEAQRYFDTGASVLGTKQSETLKASPNPTDFYNQILANRKASKDLKSGVAPEGEVIYTKNGTNYSVDPNWQPTPLKLSGDATLDKTLKSKYYSSINSQISKLADAYSLGALTKEVVASAIAGLKQYTSKGKSTLKLSAVPKIKKLKAMKINKFKKLAIKSVKYNSKITKPKAMSTSSLKKMLATQQKLMKIKYA